MIVPVVELPGTTPNMYVVHVDLMNSVLFFIIPQIGTFWSLEQNCLANINAKLLKANKHICFFLIQLSFSIS